MRRSPIALALALLLSACSGAAATEGAVPGEPATTSTTATSTPQTTTPPTTTVVTTTTGPTTTTTTTTTTSTTTAVSAPLEVTVTRDLAFGAGLDLDVYRPASGSGWPVVVLVPGGGWDEVSLGSTTALARDLAARGAVVFHTPYRLRAPEAFADVACAVGFAAATAADHGGDPSTIVLAGHSAGAHVTAVAALAGDRFATPDCATAGRNPDGWVGISGPYDVGLYGFFPALRSFFGGGPLVERDAWAAGDPFTYTGLRRDLEMGMVHGSVDLVVLPLMSLRFAEALEAGGHRVETVIVPGADHSEVLDPDDAGAVTAAVILEVARRAAGG